MVFICSLTLPVIGIYTFRAVEIRHLSPTKQIFNRLLDSTGWDSTFADGTAIARSVCQVGQGAHAFYSGLFMRRSSIRASKVVKRHCDYLAQNAAHISTKRKRVSPCHAHSLALRACISRANTS